MSKPTLKPVVSLMDYFRNSWLELGKITWPSRKVTIRLTIAVIVFSAVFALLSGIIDFGLTAAIEQVIGQPAQPAQPAVPPANGHNLPTTPTF